MSVCRAMQEISSAEFAEWMAYYRLDPQGQDRADLRSGIVAATVANASRGRKTKAYKPKDFMPDFEKAAPAATDWKAQKAKFKAFAMAHNATMKKGK